MSFVETAGRVRHALAPLQQPHVRQHERPSGVREPQRRPEQRHRDVGVGGEAHSVPLLRLLLLLLLGGGDQVGAHGVVVRVLDAGVDEQLCCQLWLPEIGYCY